MVHCRVLMGAVMILALQCLGGCVSASEEMNDAEDVDSAVDAAASQNSLSYNSLSYNGMLLLSLADQSLSTDGLDARGVVRQTLSRSRDASVVLTYVVECALPESQVIRVSLPSAGGTDRFTFRGKHGLTPEWGEINGSCDESCRKLISACVISRLNFKGERVDISLRSPRLTTTKEESIDFPIAEATYFGNIFSSDQALLACLPERARLRDLPRVCGPDKSRCPVRVVGRCDRCSGATGFGGFDSCTHDGDTFAPVAIYLRNQ